jgi:hypothetical protein
VCYKKCKTIYVTKIRPWWNHIFRFCTSSDVSKKNTTFRKSHHFPKCSIFQKHQAMDTVQKHDSSKYNTSSSKPFINASCKQSRFYPEYLRLAISFSDEKPSEGYAVICKISSFPVPSCFHFDVQFSKYVFGAKLLHCQLSLHWHALSSLSQGRHTLYLRKGEAAHVTAASITTKMSVSYGFHMSTRKKILILIQNNVSKYGMIFMKCVNYKNLTLTLWAGTHTK